jgi:hypothetical protein
MRQVWQAMTPQVHPPKVMQVQRQQALWQRGVSAVEQAQQAQRLQVRQVQRPLAMRESGAGVAEQARRP